jgi:CubicO group peptidase (beta-lactamase class C family)
MLADRGQLDVNAPVATYWPEFAQHGKQAVLVRHLLTHTAGVVGFGEQRPPLGWDGRGWDDYDAIAAGLAAAPPCWEPGTRFGYHALTYGWLVGELVRRITGQTLGAMFASEVAAPLDADLHIGTPEPIQPRVARIVDGVAASVALPFRPFLRAVQRQMADPRTLAGKAFLAHDGSCLMDHAESFFTQAPALRSEIPAGNGTGTARSLAKVYAALANGGELDGIQLVSEASVRSFRAEVIRMPDATLTELHVPVLRWLLSAPVRRSLGYLLNPAMRAERPRFGPNPAAFGHDGAGGQVGFADLDNRVAVGFVRSHLTSSSKFSARLIGAVYQAAGRAPKRTRRAARGT